MGGTALGALLVGGGAVGHVLHRINRVQAFPAPEVEALRGDAACPLLRLYPGLKRSVPWIPFGTFPTPVEELPLPTGARAGRLFVKRDDLTSALYGGNKVRKLEHLLAEATLADHTTLVTVGGFGTNHGLATAIHGRALGFRVELALYEQPLTPAVERRLEALERAGAVVHRTRTDAGAFHRARRIMGAARERGERPYFINVGGSSRLGTVGYVNAALELAEQIRAGEVPLPDRIFVALGTSGTAAGLVAGLRMAGIPSRVAAVRVTGLLPANRFLVLHFARDVAAWLHELDPSLSPPILAADDFDLIGEYRGEGYGVATPEAREAIDWAEPHLSLEATYTGKALAACLDHCRAEVAVGETLLFWNTFDAHPPGEAKG